MVLFAILLIMLVLTTLGMVVIVGTTGAVGMIVFSDVIVCLAILIFIMKWLINRNQKKKDK